MPAEQVASDAHNEPEQEGNAPTPGFQRRGRHAGRQNRTNRAAEQDAAPAPHAVSAPIKPRRPSGARSTRNTIELVYSPPTESPCNMRNSVSAAGAKRPSVAYPGNSPIRKVGIAMAATEKVS